MRKSSLVVVGVLSFGFVLSTFAGEPRTARDTKASGASFHLASTQPTPGFEKATLADGSTVFVSPRPSFSQDDVVSASATGRDAMQLTVTSDAARELERTSADRVAIYVGGRLSSTTAYARSRDGAIELTGIEGNEIARLGRMLDAGIRTPGGPEVTVVPRQQAANAGEVISFDVYVSNVGDLRTYQIAMDVVGGREGSLIRVPGQIEANRADFIFGTAQNVNAVDDTSGRLGGVRFDGGVKVEQASYVGTFNYQVPEGASGQFVAKVRMGEDSFLADTNNQTMPFSASGAAVTIGTRGTR